MGILFFQPHEPAILIEGLTHNERTLLIRETLESEAQLWHSQNITRLQSGFIILNNTEIRDVKLQSQADGVPIKVMSREEIESLSSTHPIDFGFFKKVGTDNQGRATVVLIYQWESSSISNKPIWNGGIAYEYDEHGGEWEFNETSIWTP